MPDDGNDLWQIPKHTCPVSWTPNIAIIGKNQAGRIELFGIFVELGNGRQKLFSFVVTFQPAQVELVTKSQREERRMIPMRQQNFFELVSKISLMWQEILRVGHW